MPAMTMPFDVKDTNELAGIEAGDPVSFRLRVTDTEGWIDQIRKIGPGQTPACNRPVPSRSRRGTAAGGRWVARISFHQSARPGHQHRAIQRPGARDQLSLHPLSLSDVLPVDGKNFEETQNKLLARTNGPANWHLLTISFDPQYDTPAVLKAYAESHGYDPAHWTFATGELIDITGLGEQFGLTFWHDESGGISHNCARRSSIPPAACGRFSSATSGRPRSWRRRW